MILVPIYKNVLIFVFLLIFILVPKTKIMAKENILIEKTKKEFGYYPEELSSGSSKMVVWFCSECKLEKVKSKNQANRYEICFCCSNKKKANTNKEERIKKTKEWFSKNEHPLKGTKRPQHVIDALNKANTGRVKTVKERQNISLRTSGESNPMYGKKHSEESLKKMKDFQKENPAIRGKNSNFYGQKAKHGKGNWYICKDGSKVWMRSSWEIKFAIYLDKNNIEWIYEPKAFPIFFNNKEGTYSPDFFIVKENYFIEIKGWWRDDAKIKYESFIEQYPSLRIELFDKNKLKLLKLL